MSTSESLAAPTPGTTQIVPPPAAPGAAPVAGQVGSGPAAGTPETTTPGAWLAGLNEDMRGYLGNKGFKTPEDLANSYRNLEKMRGVPAERQLNLPERMRAEDGKLTNEGRAFLERMGAPKEAKDYDIAIPKEMGDPKMADAFRQKFHEMGMPADMAKATVEAWNGYVAEQAQAAKDASAQAFRDQDGKLRTEWGAAYDQNTNIAREAVRNLGMKTEQIDALASALGHAETMKLLAKLGKATGESSFHPSAAGFNGPLSPAEARSQRDALMRDAGFQKRFNAGDKAAIDQWTRLNQNIAPGNTSFT